MGTPHLKDGAHVGASRKTRPVRCPVNVRHAGIGAMSRVGAPPKRRKADRTDIARTDWHPAIGMVNPSSRGYSCAPKGNARTAKDRQPRGNPEQPWEGT